MGFVACLAEGERPALDASVLGAVRRSTAAAEVAETLASGGMVAAWNGRVEAACFPDDVTVLVLGRPRFLDGGAAASAAETIHGLYRRHGRDLVDRVMGSFMILVHDPVRKTSLLFRDRIGFIPAFYCLAGGALWISSGVRPILAARPVPFSLDVPAIYRYLYLKAFESPDTPVCEIRSLEPGHVLSWRDGKAESLRYWSLPLPSVRRADEGEKTVEELESLLQDAVSDGRGQTGGGDALLLSGGVDSSLLAAMIGRNGPGRALAYNVTFDGEYRPLDESRYAEIAAQSAGLPLKKVSFSLQNVIRSLPTLFWDNLVPTANSGFKLALVAGRAAGTGGGRWVLGEGADTLLDYGWKWPYFNRLDRLFRLGGLLAPRSSKSLALFEEVLYRIRPRLGSSASEAVGILQSYAASRLGYWKWKGSRFRPRDAAALFADAHRGMVGARLVSQVFDRHYALVAGGDWAEKLIAGSLTSYTPNQQLTNYHAIAHDHGGELACPYLDERVIAYCLGLPVPLRRDKRILKDVARRRLPPEVIERRKQVFMVPMADWMKGPLRPLVDLALGEEAAGRRGLFNTAAMEDLKRSFLDGVFTSWSDVWSFVLLEAWLRLNWDAPDGRRPETLDDIFPEIEGKGAGRRASENEPAAAGAGR